MDSIPDVDIDKNGKFKYILLKISDSKSGKDKLIVRGNGRGEYHDDILNEVSPNIERAGLKADCLGGGKMVVNPDKKTINVFGESQGFGRADHSKSIDILKKSFKNYEITSNEGDN